MPAKIEPAPDRTLETSRTTSTDLSSPDRATPPAEPSCACDQCLEVGRDEMWIRWA